MGSIIAITLLIILIWFWFSAIKAKERAVQAAFVACRELEMQFLDQTVSLEKLKSARNDKGQLVLLRIYGFDYTVEGNERRHGRIFILGQQLQQIQMDTSRGVVIEDKISATTSAKTNNKQ